jgi:hypothetical protein
MELQLIRTYFTKGTNGVLLVDGKFFCYTIELPWLDNSRHISCIPEDCYALAKRSSEHLGAHLLLQEVPGRDLILVHRANDAQKDLQGCIAPVSYHTGPGRGDYSDKMFEPLLKLVYKALDRGEVLLHIFSSPTIKHATRNRPTGVNSPAAGAYAVVL